MPIRADHRLPTGRRAVAAAALLPALALATACGHDGKSLLKSSETASVQAEYDRYTDQAIAASVFGSPWYQYEGEGYWGQDRLDFLERAFGK